MPTAPGTVTTAKMRLLALIAGNNVSPGVEFAGNAGVFAQLLALLDTPDTASSIVVP